MTGAAILLRMILGRTDMGKQNPTSEKQN
jgi:hypothetical protein